MHWKAVHKETAVSALMFFLFKLDFVINKIMVFFKLKAVKINMDVNLHLQSYVNSEKVLLSTSRLFADALEAKEDIW